MNKPGRVIYRDSVGNLDVFVRYPQEGDTSEMCSYINTISKEKTYIAWQGEETSLLDEEKYLKNQLEKISKNETVQLLLYANDELSGISSIDLRSKIKSHIGGFGITIAKKYRGKGLGKLLMKLVLEESSKKLAKLKIVTLAVFAENENAIRMYKNFGFKEYGRLPKGLLYRDKLVNEIEMYKSL